MQKLFLKFFNSKYCPIFLRYFKDRKYFQKYLCKKYHKKCSIFFNSKYYCIFLRKLKHRKYFRKYLRKKIHKIVQYFFHCAKITENIYGIFWKMQNLSQKNTKKIRKKISISFMDLLIFCPAPPREKTLPRSSLILNYTELIFGGTSGTSGRVNFFVRFSVCTVSTVSTVSTVTTDRLNFFP